MRLKLRALGGNRYAHICCEKYFYVWPEPDEWQLYPDIKEARKSGLEPYHICSYRITKLRNLISANKSEEAWLLLMTWKLAGEV